MPPNPMLYTLDRPLENNDVLVGLASVTEQLRQLFDGVTEQQASRSAGEGEWSAFRVLCHMRDAAIVYSARFRWMVFDVDPILPNFDENGWVDAAKDTPADIPAILDFIEASRADLVRVLSRMPAEAWQRTGRHEIAGTVVLEDYVRHQLAHEEGHLGEIAAALKLELDLPDVR